MGDKLIIVDRHAEIAKIIPEIVAKVTALAARPAVQEAVVTETHIIL
jgi:hypothetical protein